MWLIFITACVAVALVAMAALWLCSMIYLSIQRHIRKFQKEVEQDKEEIKDEERA